MAFKVFFPEEIDLSRLMQNTPPSFEVSDAKLQKMQCILGLISDQFVHNRDRLGMYDYVNIHSSLFQKIDHDYKEVLDYLNSTLGVIWCDNKYITNEKSLGYKFAPNYQGVVTSHEITNFPLCKKFRNRQKQYKTNCSFLDRWMNTGLKVDYYLAKTAARNRYLNDLENKDSKAKGRYNAALVLIERLHSGDIYYSRDSNVRRYHSILTNMPKDIRNFITFNGIPLCSVDVKSSQPTLSCVFFDEKFYSNERDSLGYTLGMLPPEKKLKFETNYTQNSYEWSDPTVTNTNIEYITTITGTIQQYLMSVKASESLENSSIYKYKSLIREGKLYEYFLTEKNKKQGLKDRDAAKKAFFYMMFSDSKDFYGSSSWSYFKRAFADEFPDVFELFEIIKTNEYELFSTVLQLIESEIVIDRACCRIARERPKLFIATIYDSIITTKGDEHYVNQVLKEELIKVLGFEPILEIEYWSPENSKCLE